MKARDFPFDPVRIACAACARQCLYRRKDFIDLVGAETNLSEALARISADCPKRRARKPYDQCLARYPELDDEPGN